MDLFKCSKCKKQKERSAFYESRFKDERRVVDRYCKECRAQRYRDKKSKTHSPCDQCQKASRLVEGVCAKCLKAVGKRFCSRCQVVKSHLDFHGRKIVCASCVSQTINTETEVLTEAARFGALTPPQKRRDTFLRSKYGITINAYWKMEQDQEGVCAVCNLASDKKALAVDHCHKTGKVRQLLCHNCNVGIGNFQDNAELLIRAAAYVQQHS